MGCSAASTAGLRIFRRPHDDGLRTSPLDRSDPVYAPDYGQHAGAERDPMTVVYAISVTLGILGLLGWAGFAVAAGSSSSGARFDPERKFGERGRAVLAGVTGFGMGGMSATFAGWNSATALLAAVAGAAVMAFLAIRLGPEPESE